MREHGLIGSVKTAYTWLLLVGAPINQRGTSQKFIFCVLAKMQFVTFDRSIQFKLEFATTMEQLAELNLINAAGMRCGGNGCVQEQLIYRSQKN